MHAYQDQRTPQTLREGLAEYYRNNPGLKRGDTLSPRARDFFRSHDAIHVLYGCDTTLQHEAIVKLSSFFGADGGKAVMDGYRLYDSIDIYRQLRLSDILATIASAFVSAPRTLMRCSAQTKRWPWADFERHLDTPLSELRAEYGVRVAVSERAARAYAAQDRRSAC